MSDVLDAPVDRDELAGVGVVGVMAVQGALPLPGEETLWLALCVSSASFFLLVPLLLVHGEGHAVLARSGPLSVGPDGGPVVPIAQDRGVKILEMKKTYAVAMMMLSCLVVAIADVEFSSQIFFAFLVF